MTGVSACSPNVWLPLLGIILMAALALYCWRHLSVPGALPLFSSTLFGSLWLLAIALQAAATTPAAAIAWFKFQTVWKLPTTTAVTCFVLEYTYPGRWLTRRNLSLLWLPSLLVVLLVIINDGQFMWSSLRIRADGSVAAPWATGGVIASAYGVGLILANAAALLWLFVRSPQHRWPVVFMLLGQIGARGLFLLDAAELPGLPSFALAVGTVLMPAVMYTIALFGFHILDPLPVARATILQQMREGLVVFDDRWRIVTMNPAATRMLDVQAAWACGKTWQDIVPASANLSGSPISILLPDEAGRQLWPLPDEITLGSGEYAHSYALALSPLRDFRGLLMGYMLMLHDITEQRHAQGQLVQQQRTLAVLQERERLAREMHDGLGQALAAAHLQASTAKILLARGEFAQVNECLDNLTETTLQAEADVREYLLSARTTLWADRPFFLMLREYLGRFTVQYKLPVQLIVPPAIEEQRLAKPVEVQLFRIIQEALSNVRKHARAGCARISFAASEQQLRVVIADDGQGFDPAATTGRSEGYGLRAMRERAEALGGNLAVSSSPGHGTRVTVTLPIES